MVRADGDQREGRLTGAREAVRTLNPGYFALVMATGIVSIAMHCCFTRCGRRI
jgi:hypothetical protein